MELTMMKGGEASADLTLMKGGVSTLHYMTIQ